MDAKAQAFGAAQLPAATKQWHELTALLEEIAAIERRVIKEIW